MCKPIRRAGYGQSVARSPTGNKERPKQNRPNLGQINEERFIIQTVFDQFLWYIAQCGGSESCIVQIQRQLTHTYCSPGTQTLAWRCTWWSKHSQLSLTVQLIHTSAETADCAGTLGRLWEDCKDSNKCTFTYCKWPIAAHLQYLRPTLRESPSNEFH